MNNWVILSPNLRITTGPNRHHFAQCRAVKKARHVLCRVGESVTHVRVKNDGDCFNLIGPGGETFASLSDLVRYYYDNKDRQELRDTAGTAIYLKYPLPSVDHSSERYIWLEPSSASYVEVLV